MQISGFITPHPTGVSGGDSPVTVANSASSAEIFIGTRKKFVISCDGAFHLARGRTGMVAAVADDMWLPAGVWTFETPKGAWSYIRVWNDSGVSIHFWITPLMNS